MQSIMVSNLPINYKQAVFKGKPITVGEFRKVGNELCDRLQGVVPYLKRTPEEAKTVDELKELLLKSTNTRITDEGDKRLLSLLQRMEKSFESGIQEEQTFSVFA